MTTNAPAAPLSTDSVVLAFNNGRLVGRLPLGVAADIYLADCLAQCGREAVIAEIEEEIGRRGYSRLTQTVTVERTAS